MKKRFRPEQILGSWRRVKGRRGHADLDRFDGRRTLNEIVALHQQRWKISFFEARGMIFNSLRLLVRASLLTLVALKDAPPPP
ncbi:MAG: hypothetical protein IT578_11620 [Verrucomicrobiae bacterium]|nr:hypothetical protein [Verrucomicrobiae bacterium]